MRTKQLFALIITLAAAVVTPPAVCYAEGGIVLSQAYVQDTCMDVFVTGDLSTENLSVKVSNRPAAVTAGGSVTDRGITVRTAVLLDISTSMPPAIRDIVRVCIDSLIEHITANEQFKIVTFAEQLTVLRDFTSDRYDLADAAGKIEFTGQQSKIYDAIYNTIPEVRPIDGEPCYYRTIVITDGVDDTASGVTKEELYLKLQSDTYPIDVVAVSKAKQAEPEKELSALTRMSGGRYVNLYPEVDASGLSSALAVNGVCWLRAEIPASLLDGSTRQVDISDGSNSVQFDVKVSVFDAPAAETPEPTPESTETAAAATAGEPGNVEAPIPPTESEPESSKSFMTLFGDYTPVVFIGAGVLLIILTAVIVAVAVTRGKKKKRSETEANGQSAAADELYREKTEYIGDVNADGSQFTVKLSSFNNPSKNWTLPVIGELIIGRDEHCAIQLDDKSVSREQCKIVIGNSGLAVVHLSRTNKTSLNGVDVTTGSPLRSGDTLKFGREVLHMDYIRSLGVAPPPREPEKSSSGNKTESIF
jgi:hypothetical protein